ncbi:MAG: ankyrin repeat domain-containing protein [Proteobacteria bacterium]|nr:MAG: ankyrin repeat domain-containing protein [Pseudomonadota bacterium]
MGNTDIKEELESRALAESRFADSEYDPSSKATAEIARFAAEQERLDVLTKVFSCGFIPSHVYEDGANLMHYALAPEVVRFLGAHGVVATKADNKGRTPLHMVSSSAHPKAVMTAKLLLDGGADVYAVDNDGRTSLDAAETAANAFGDGSIYKVLREEADRKMNKDGAKGCVVLIVLLIVGLYVLYKILT